MSSTSERWVDLPWLTNRLDPSPPPQSSSRPNLLEDYIKLRKLVPPAGRSSDPDSPDAPKTPPAQIFRLGTKTQEVLEDAEKHIDELWDLVGDAYGQIHQLDRIEDCVRTRRRNGALAVDTISSFQDAIEKLFVQLTQCEGDLADISNLVFTATRQIIAVAETFYDVPIVPVSWPALHEMLEIYHRQESLYHEMWQRYAMVNDQIKPLSDALSTLQQQVSHLGGTTTAPPSASLSSAAPSGSTIPAGSTHPHSAGPSSGPPSSAIHPSGQLPSASSALVVSSAARSAAGPSATDPSATDPSATDPSAAGPSSHIISSAQVTALHDHLTRLEVLAVNVEKSAKLELMKEMGRVWKELLRQGQPIYTEANIVVEATTLLRQGFNDLREAHAQLQALVESTRIDLSVVTQLSDLGR